MGLPSEWLFLMQDTRDRIQNGLISRQKLNEEEKKFLKNVYVTS